MNLSVLLWPALTIFGAMATPYRVEHREVILPSLLVAQKTDIARPPNPRRLSLRTRSLQILWDFKLCVGRRGLSVARWLADMAGLRSGHRGGREETAWGGRLGGW